LLQAVTANNGEQASKRGRMKTAISQKPLDILHIFSDWHMEGAVHINKLNYD